MLFWQWSDGNPQNKNAFGVQGVECKSLGSTSLSKLRFKEIIGMVKQSVPHSHRLNCESQGKFISLGQFQLDS